ncbi:uncharacterized protein SAZU_3421 [Streptomyces azureus]|uniref:Uncharacterized protein n=1 Tax=Streptomyces azureus TaxID=146537 RepID=A0A0K8PL22_STRAJ|nr:uncharacterized protein SAZU_3421 [Streptomyces azureus]
MSEGYEGNTGKACVTGPQGRRRSAGGTATTSDHAGIPFLGHVFRVSEFRRDHLHLWRAAPDGWIRQA